MKKKLLKMMVVFCVTMIFIQLLCGTKVEAGTEEANDCNDKRCMVCGEYEFDIENGLIFTVYGEDGILLKNTFDESGFRSTKESAEKCEFKYVDTMLIEEIRDGNVIEYIYEHDKVYDYQNLIGFEYKGERYYYIRDKQLRIIGIENQDCEILVEYVYSENSNYVESVVSCVSNRVVDESEIEFIGNINRIRGINAYYDIETGWYYENGMFYSPKDNKIIGKTHHDEDILCSDYLSSMFEICRYNYDLDEEITLWQESLLDDDTFNSSVNLSESPWYDHLSEVETVARIIYGENTNSISDQKCVSWVVRNRCVDWGIWPKEAVTQAKQFSPADPEDICVNAVKTQNSNDPCWRNAVYMACLICTTEDEDDWNSLNLPPQGMRYQKYFRGVSARKYFCEDGDFISLGSTAICDVYVPNYGQVDSYNELLYAFECCQNVNVFFEYY